jgi:hypothetical protein
LARHFRKSPHDRAVTEIPRDPRQLTGAKGETCREAGAGLTMLLLNHFQRLPLNQGWDRMGMIRIVDLLA